MTTRPQTGAIRLGEIESVQACVAVREQQPAPRNVFAHTLRLFEDLLQHEVVVPAPTRGPSRSHSTASHSAHLLRVRRRPLRGTRQAVSTAMSPIGEVDHRSACGASTALASDATKYFAVGRRPSRTGGPAARCHDLAAVRPHSPRRPRTSPRRAANAAATRSSRVFPGDSSIKCAKSLGCRFFGGEPVPCPLEPRTQHIGVLDDTVVHQGDRPGAIGRGDGRLVMLGGAMRRPACVRDPALGVHGSPELTKSRRGRPRGLPACESPHPRR